MGKITKILTTIYLEKKQLLTICIAIIFILVCILKSAPCQTKYITNFKFLVDYRLDLKYDGAVGRMLTVASNPTTTRSTRWRSMATYSATEPRVKCTAGTAPRPQTLPNLPQRCQVGFIIKPRSYLAEYFFRLFTIAINSAIANNLKQIGMMELQCVPI